MADTMVSLSRSSSHSGIPSDYYCGFDRSGDYYFLYARLHDLNSYGAGCLPITYQRIRKKVRIGFAEVP